VQAFETSLVDVICIYIRAKLKKDLNETMKARISGTWSICSPCFWPKVT